MGIKKYKPTTPGDVKWPFRIFRYHERRSRKKLSSFVEEEVGREE